MRAGGREPADHACLREAASARAARALRADRRQPLATVCLASAPPIAGWPRRRARRPSPTTTGRVGAMQPHRTVDEAPTSQRPASTLVTAPVVPQRSARRATARRASNRRATAQLHKDDIEERVSDYLDLHPLSTTGELAKGLNADRGKVAAARSQIAHAGETGKDHTAR